MPEETIDKYDRLYGEEGLNHSEEEHMKTAEKQKSNDEVIQHLMIFGNPMKQLVILHAITHYVDMVERAGPEAVRKQFDERGGGFIDATSWYACCMEIKQALDQHLEQEKA